MFLSPFLRETKLKKKRQTAVRHMAITSTLKSAQNVFGFFCWGTSNVLSIYLSILIKQCTMSIHDHVIFGWWESAAPHQFKDHQIPLQRSHLLITDWLTAIYTSIWRKGRLKQNKTTLLTPTGHTDHKQKNAYVLENIA